MGHRARALGAACAAALLLASAPARAGAAEYPSAAIHIIVSVPPGGGVDTVTRIVADKLRQRLGQPVVVENRGGAAGNLGAEAVAAAAPDGYTLLAAMPAPLTINALLYRKLNYDPAALVPVIVMTSVPNVLAVRRDFPAKTARDFIAYAKANPGKLNYASQGNGTTSHLSAELFQRLTGVKLVHVPYKGTAPAINDLIAGHVDLMFAETASALQLHRAGKARILAVATARRIDLLPDVPTMEEAGVAGFESGTWNAIAAPPRTPAAIVAKLNAAINEVLAMPDVQARLRAISLRPVGGTPADMEALIKADTQRWGEVIRAANVTIE